MGDVGRGDERQYDTARQMAAWHEQFSFDLVLMLGDNIYGPGTPEEYARRFEAPYSPLLDRDVRFRAVVGNHDPPGQERYAPFGMDGRRYYTFTRLTGPLWSPRRVQFFAVDTLDLNAAQLAWLRRELEASDAGWKIAFYHYPLYTSGEYKWRAAAVRRQLEPLFVDAGLDVGFNGHEHFY
jgi:acid phosphatase